MNKSQQNKIKWYMLSFMCFSTLWGFGNVLNGFVYFNGTQVIFSWILMFALYFVPYALMVGELGSAFKNSGGGVSSWIHETTGAKAAYYAGWTYWACHVTYIASKGSGGLKALSWMIFQNAEKYASFNTKAVQLVTFAVLLGCKPRLKPVKETGYPGGNQYVCHEYPVHSADVCCTGHQSERWLPVGGFQLEKPDSAF